MQASFSDLEYAAKRRVTRRDRFLSEIEAVTPWLALVAEIEPFYPKGVGRGRPPIGVHRMLRMYIAQQCFGLSRRTSRLQRLIEIKDLEARFCIGGEKFEWIGCSPLPIRCVHGQRFGLCRCFGDFRTHFDREVRTTYAWNPRPIQPTMI